MKEVTAQEAFEMMQKDQACIYLDVRSVPEFEAGHAAGAINVPLLHFSPERGMHPNPEFLRVVEAAVSRDARIVVGCKSGGRSARACELLSSMGYTDVANVRGGYSGLTDNFGRTVAPGWSTLGLPTCGECSEDASYESLSRKSGA